MINELLDMTDRWDASQPAFKVVKVRLGRKFFCYNDRADQPIFNKKALSYDKHELAKIISYQQLELLFRPFKNHPSFRDFVRWWWIFIAFGVIFVLLAILLLVLLDPKHSKQNQLTFFIFMAVFSLILLAFPFLREAKMKNVSLKFSQFCTSLNSSLIQFSIKMIRTKFEKINQQYVEVELAQGQYPNLYQAYIYVQSKKIYQDNQYIKLYKSRSSDVSELLCNSEERPIYRTAHFSFDKRKLNRLILFEDLQLLLRPFKANYYYQRRFFWNRFAFISILSVYLAIIPLLVLRQYPNLSLFIALGYVAFVYFWFVFGVCKSTKMKALMLHQFKEYCHNISLSNPRTEIIVHLYDTKDKKACIHMLTSLYCIQLRLKEQQTGIIT